MPRLTASLLPLLCALPLAGACRSNDPPELSKEQRLGEYLERALRYIELKDYDRALQQTNQALEVDPQNERFLLMLAKLHQMRGSLQDLLLALSVYERHPAQDDFRVQLGLGESHERIGLIKQESADKIESGETYTDAPDPRERARELRAEAQADWEEAYRAYLRSNDLHRGEVPVVNGLVRITTLLRREHESVQWARALVDVLAESTRLRRIELEAPDLSANRERALMAAIRSNTEMTSEAHMHVAGLYFRLGLYQETADELSRVIEIDPKRADAYSQRAQVLFELGRYEQADDSVQQFLVLSSHLDFDHPDIRAAFDLQSRCRAAAGRGGQGR